MSKLDEIKGKKKVRLLKDVHFDFEGAELSYTLGAASLKDEPYLLKKKDEALSEEEEKLLKELNESSNEGVIPSEETGDNPNNNVEKGNKKPMTTENVDLQKQLDDLKHELEVSKAVNKLIKYSFEDEVQKALADAIATLGDKQEAVFNALDVLVEKAKTQADEAVNKAKEQESKEENALQKALQEEAGHSEEVEVEKQDKNWIEEAQEKLNAKKGAK